MHLPETITKKIRGQRGITGIETAIIMISFVVVASIFAYTVLTAGVFTASKGQQAINAGIDRAGSAMELIGPLIAKDNNADGNVDQIVFIVSNILGGQGIDFTPTIDSNGDGLLSDEPNQRNTTVISYYDATQAATDLAWTTTQLGKGDNDAILDEGEKFEVTVDVSHLATRLQADDTFTMEVRPRNGTVLTFERSTPPVIDKVNELD